MASMRPKGDTKPRRYPSRGLGAAKAVKTQFGKQTSPVPKATGSKSAAKSARRGKASTRKPKASGGNKRMAK